MTAAVRKKSGGFTLVACKVYLEEVGPCLKGCESLLRRFPFRKVAAIKGSRRKTGRGFASTRPRHPSLWKSSWAAWVARVVPTGSGVGASMATLAVISY